MGLDLKTMPVQPHTEMKPDGEQTAAPVAHPSMPGQINLGTFPVQADPDAVKPKAAKDFGVRADGTPKGMGFFGALVRPDGRVSTELSIGVEFDGKEIEIPSLVPTLNQEEKDYLLAGGKPTTEIIQKAVDYAQPRIAAGKSPFATAKEMRPTEPFVEEITKKTIDMQIVPVLGGMSVGQIKGLKKADQDVQGLIKSAVKYPYELLTGQLTRHHLESAAAMSGSELLKGAMPALEESPSVFTQWATEMAGTLLDWGTKPSSWLALSALKLYQKDLFDATMAAIAKKYPKIYRYINRELSTEGIATDKLLHGETLTPKQEAAITAKSARISKEFSELANAEKKIQSAKFQKAKKDPVLRAKLIKERMKTEVPRTVDDPKLLPAPKSTVIKTPTTGKPVEIIKPMSPKEIGKNLVLDKAGEPLIITLKDTMPEVKPIFPGVEDSFVQMPKKVGLLPQYFTGTNFQLKKYGFDPQIGQPVREALREWRIELADKMDALRETWTEHKGTMTDEEWEVAKAKLWDFMNKKAPVGGDATRGKGIQYHGTSEEIGDLTDYKYSTLNYYGQGFYTSDAIDVAKGYSKKGKGKSPAIYKIAPGKDVKLYDMEKTITDADKKLLAPALGEYADILEETTNLREVFDELREVGSADFLTADDIQVYFDSIRSTLEELGYQGMQHKGGIRTNTEAHTVNIYWNPSKTIGGLEKVEIDTSIEAQIYNKWRQETEDMLTRMNAVLKKMGMKPIERLENYMFNMVKPEIMKAIYETGTVPPEVAELIGTKRMDSESMKKFIQKLYKTKELTPEQEKMVANGRMTKELFLKTAEERMGIPDEFLNKDPYVAMRAMYAIDLKYIHLQNVLAEIEPYIRAVEKYVGADGDTWSPRVFEYLDNWVTHAIKGKASSLDGVVNDTLGTVLAPLFNALPGNVATPSWSQIVNVYASAVHSGALSARPKAILRNLIQSTFDWVNWGTEAYIKGVALFHTKEGFALLNQSSLWKTRTPIEAQDWNTMQAILKVGNYPYKLSDLYNVGKSILTVYSYAKDTLGYSHEQAIQFASNETPGSQWSYLREDMPQAFWTTTGRAFWTLGSWWMRFYTEFMPELLRKSWSGVDAGGRVVPTTERLGTLRFLILLGTLYGVKKASKALFGIAIDYTQQLMPTPSQSPMGQMLAGATALAQALTSKDGRRANEALQAIANSAKITIPYELALEDIYNLFSGKKSFPEIIFYVDKDASDSNRSSKRPKKKKKTKSKRRG